MSAGHSSWGQAVVCQTWSLEVPAGPNPTWDRRGTPFPDRTTRGEVVRCPRRCPQHRHNNIILSIWPLVLVAVVNPLYGPPRQLSGKESICQCWRCKFDPCISSKMSWRREWLPHSSIRAWEVSWTEEPAGLQSLGSQRLRHD